MMNEEKLEGSEPQTEDNPLLKARPVTPRLVRRAAPIQEAVSDEELLFARLRTEDRL